MDKIEVIELLQELLANAGEAIGKCMTVQQRNECEQFLANLKTCLLY